MDSEFRQRLHWNMAYPLSYLPYPVLKVLLRRPRFLLQSGYFHHIEIPLRRQSGRIQYRRQAFHSNRTGSCVLYTLLPLDGYRNTHFPGPSQGRGKSKVQLGLVLLSILPSHLEYVLPQKRENNHRFLLFRHRVWSATDLLQMKISFARCLLDL